MNRSLIYIASALLLLSSCNKDEEWAPPAGNNAVKISATVGGPQTRVNTEGDATAFQPGESIFIENLNQAMANHANRSAVYTFNGTKWAPENGKWLAWDESNGPTTRNEFLAYTPVTTGTTKFDFFLPADQSTIEKLRSADYMIAAAIETPETDKQVELKFSHMLAKITVTIFGDEGTIDNVRIISPLSGVGEGATDLNAEITPYAQYDSENGCYRYIAVIAPGTYNDDELLRYAKDGVTISVQIPSTLTDKKINYGKHYQLTIHEDISIGTVTVSDWTDVEDPIDAPTATEPEASYSISGTSATITVPEYASDASVQAAITAVAADASVTTIAVDGTLTDAQQTALATGLTGYSGTLILEDMSSDDVTVDALKNMTVVYNGYVLDSTTNTYQVYTANGLYAWATATETDATTCLKLMADITLPNKDADGNEITVTDGKPSGSNWTPVGTSSSPYSGSIDGSGKTITGLRISSESEYVGFVGNYQTSYDDQEIKNLHLDDVAVYSTQDYVGGILGYNSNVPLKISECSVKSGSVISTGSNVGGIVGVLLRGTITNCENHATISGNYYIGGIVGELNRGDVTGCANTGAVTGTEHGGGIVGLGSNYSNSNNDVHIIAGCYNSGTVTNGGGIFGRMNKAYTVIACVNTGNVVNGAGIGQYNAGKVVASYTTQNSAVAFNDLYGNGDANNAGSIEATYYLLGEDDAIDGTNGVSDLNTDEVVKTMNDAISTWTDSDENACAYMWQIGTTYPELVANTAN